MNISDFKNNLMEKNTSGLVLDVDETLSWTIGVWVKEMQLKFGNPEGLTIREMVDKYRYVQEVPYWQSDEAKIWVADHITDNEMQKNIEQIKGASIYVNKINNIVPIVAYLTTRPQSVVDGTAYWLEKNNFPDVEILARPIEVPRAEGNLWKAGVLEYLYPQVVGIVDDNIAVAQYLHADYQGKFFLFNHQDAVDLAIEVINCPTWPDVYAYVEAGKISL